MVQLRNGQVASYTYRDARGLRVVDSPADATADARTAAMADALIREADEMVANGDMVGALDRYDRASTLKPRDAMLEYRIASILDRSLRPVEALMRYKRFLHQMELEKIEAYGDAHAKLADAIARARERVIILEKR
jgi:Flp pilus assembly protein TadD